MQTETVDSEACQDSIGPRGPLNVRASEPLDLTSIW